MPERPPTTALGLPVIYAVPAYVHGSHVMLGAEIALRCGSFRLCQTVDEVPYDRARDNTFQMAIEAGCELMMSVDGDTRAPTGAFTQLWQTMCDTGAVIVAADYPKRAAPPQTTWRDWEGDKYVLASHPPGSGAHEIAGCGMGCTLLNLGWIDEHLAKPFYVGKEELYGAGGDYFLCNKVRGAGGTVVGQSDCQAMHYVLGGLLSMEDSGNG